ncbi:hypothetical protein K432DRAFT_271195, partial [Lepidopterella palustris CBS 459.81]
LDVIRARLGISWATAAVGMLIGAPIAAALADFGNDDVFVNAQAFSGAVIAAAVILLI